MPKQTKEFKILCPFCNAPYTAEMIEDLDVSLGCPTCGDNSIAGTIEIKCSNCKKVIYKKEIDTY